MRKEKWFERGTACETPVQYLGLIDAHKHDHLLAKV
jgi:hypothetical protein